jgi:hypothetical protein
MTKSFFDTRTSEGAIRWLLDQKMIVRRHAKDPETFATAQGFILSDELRHKLGSNLVRLVAKATRRGNGRLGNVSIRDAFLTAAMAAVLETTGAPLSDDEMTRCANIIFALLPIEPLEKSGLADKPLRTVVRSRSSVLELQRLLRLRA